MPSRRAVRGSAPLPMICADCSSGIETLR